MVMFNFEKLEVCQKAIAFADLVYDHTKQFSADSAAEETGRMLSGLRKSLISNVM